MRWLRARLHFVENGYANIKLDDIVAINDDSECKGSYILTRGHHEIHSSESPVTLFAAINGKDCSVETFK